MLLELTLIAGTAAGVYFRMDALNELATTKAKKAGVEPKLLDMSNPIHWISAIIGLGAYGVGYAPTAIRRGVDETKTAYAEAKKEVQEADVVLEASNKAMRRAGASTSHRHHDPRIQELLKRRAALES